MSDDDDEFFPVIVVGGGPVGEYFSALLARQYGIRHLLIERETSIPQDPRALSLGDYSVRMLQNLGLHDKITTEIGCARAGLHFLGGKHTDFHRKPFMRMNLLSLACTGHSKVFTFFQPAMEANLRQVVAEYGKGVHRYGCEVVKIEENEDEHFVYVTYEEIATKKRRRVPTDFVIGTDGRRGFVRKGYLEPRGVLLEHSHPYKELFYGMNWEVTLPTKESHPDFPLWKLGYTPEQVGEEFIPREFIIICNPNRYGCSSRIGVYDANPFCWRTEFAVLPDEDPNEMASEENGWKSITPYLTHSGKRYGLAEDVQFPLDCVRLRRNWYYLFEARQCNKWRVGRVMLAGDSAHIFPPFGGQGLQSGFFDVQGLAWRLSLIMKIKSPHATLAADHGDNYSRILDSWVLERTAHIEQQLEYSMRVGLICTETNPVKIFARDWMLWFLQLSEQKRKQMEEMPLTPPRYLADKNGNAVAFLPHMEGGKYWWQVFCEVLKEGAGARDTAIANGSVNGSSNNGNKTVANGRVCFTDDIIFTRSKENHFQLVVLLDSAEQLSATEELLQQFPERLDEQKNDNKWKSRTELASQLIQESTIIINDVAASVPATSSSGGKSLSQHQQTVARVISTDKLMISAPSLYLGPPDKPPRGYDPLALKKLYGTTPFVLVRPDRFVYAACKNVEELREAVDHLYDLLESCKY